jgi:hypothetical protein
LLLLLLFVGVGSAASVRHHSSAKSNPLRAIQREKRLGPKPTPRWYWRWAAWRLGEGYAKGHPRQRNLRPKQAPRRIPHWAWRRLHFFLLARAERGSTMGPTTTTGTMTTTPTTTTASTTTADTTTATTPAGSVAWRGDYESGDFSQWWLTQFGGASSGCGGPCGPAQVGNTSATIVTAPVAQGTYAAEFRVQPCLSGCPNDRAEIMTSQAQAGGYLGQEWWYGWWTYFPSGQTFWSGGGDWNAINQFSGGGSVGGVEGIGINAASYPTPHLQENSRVSGRHDLGVLQFNHWTHFVIHARYEQDSTGVFQVYVDGTLLADLREPTMQTGTTSPVIEISQGYYTNADSDNTVIQDGMCRATSYDAAAGC